MYGRRIAGKSGCLYSTLLGLWHGVTQVLGAEILATSFRSRAASRSVLGLGFEAFRRQFAATGPPVRPYTYGRAPPAMDSSNNTSCNCSLMQHSFSTSCNFSRRKLYANFVHELFIRNEIVGDRR